MTRLHVTTRKARLTYAIGILLAVAACAPTHVQTTQSYSGAKLPRPDVVLINDFSASSDNVELDRGLAARLSRSFEKTSTNEQQLAAGQKVAAALSDTLVREIRKLGLPAQRVDGRTTMAAGNRLIVNGQLLSIDEGNRTRRNLIGFGAGRSSVKAQAQVYYDAPGAGARLIESFAADTESGRKPGAVATLGAGAAAGRVAETAAVSTGASVASETLSANVDAGGERIAKEIAKQLAHLFAAQGWTTQTSASPLGAGR